MLTNSTAICSFRSGHSSQNSSILKFFSLISLLHRSYEALQCLRISSVGVLFCCSHILLSTAARDGSINYNTNKSFKCDNFKWKQSYHLLLLRQLLVGAGSCIAVCVLTLSAYSCAYQLVYL